MKIIFVLATLLSNFAVPAAAHRLDELLQASIISFQAHEVELALRIVPGVAVASQVIATIDTDHDGAFSTKEQSDYAQKVLSDLQLMEDGRVLPLHLVTVSLPSPEEMRVGTGEAKLRFSASLLDRPGRHNLSFSNYYRSPLSVYLVNSLTPQDQTTQLGTQLRSRNQANYQVAFAQIGNGGNVRSRFSWSGFGAAFRLGARHIAEGTDHLLFLFTLLLATPGAVLGGLGDQRSKLRRSLVYILRVVTAFTLGHSLTLVLAGLGIVRLPSQPVEVFIALSILVSAVHVLRPIFIGREVFVAGAFGLVHGLAFASALDALGVSGWYRLISLLGFNLGIEAVQIALVVIVAPALVQLSSSRHYGFFQQLGAAFAMTASLAWIVERIWNRSNVISGAVEATAHYGSLLLLAFWITTMLVRIWESQRDHGAALDVHRNHAGKIASRSGSKWIRRFS